MTGSKAKSTTKQKRQAKHIEERATQRGYSTKRAAQIVYAPVNKQDGGGKKSGSGRGKVRDTSASRTAAKRSHKGAAKQSSKKR